jgi:serine O-acetyltransferase
MLFWLNIHIKNLSYKVNRAIFYIKISLFIPFLFIHRNRNVIKADVIKWLRCYNLKMTVIGGFMFLMFEYSEFRNLFYLRIRMNWLPGLILQKNKTLRIDTSAIGKGLFIQHGDTTVIQAKSIGENCWINQCVTIMGYGISNGPVILNNVTICAGAKVIGNITIGNNSVIGANAVVEKDVPDNCTITGVPGIITKRNGVKVKEQL